MAAPKFPPYEYRPYPKKMYCKDWPNVEAVTVNNDEEQGLLEDEGWATTPAAHGIETHPSALKNMSDRTGVDFDKLREKKALKKRQDALDAAKEVEEKEESEEETKEEESTEEETEEDTAPKKKKNGRK